MPGGTTAVINEATYTAVMRGEDHTFHVPGLTEVNESTLAKRLSDLTGYKESYLAGRIRNLFKSEERKIEIQSAYSGPFGGAPYFEVRYHESDMFLGITAASKES